MEVKVGVKGVARELVVETDLTPDDVSSMVRACAADPAALSTSPTAAAAASWCRQTSSPTSSSASRKRAASASAPCS